MFYLICAWYDYYPESGIGNIKYLTYSEEKAIEKCQELKAKGYDRVDWYESSDLELI